MPEILGPSDVHIWYRATDVPESSTPSVLSADERARRDRFVFERDRRDFSEAHALLRRALSRYADIPPTDWTFGATAEGKPFLAPGCGDLSFNLSHTHGLVACAITRGADVGIDVELLDRAVDERGIARRFFTAAEAAAIDACAAGERQARFIEFWTLKEAYIKAIGRGLGYGLEEFGFALEGARDIRFDAPPDVDAAGWEFALFVPQSRARMAVAVRRSPSADSRIFARADDGSEVNAIRQSAPRLRFRTQTRP